MNTAFKRNLVISFGISLLLVLSSSITSYISIRNLLYSQAMVDHSNAVIIKLENAISILKDGETGQRGYLITGKAEFLEPYNGALEKVNRIIDEIETLTIDNMAQQQNISQLKDMVTKRYALLQAVIDDKKLGRAPSLEAMETGRMQMDGIRRLTQQMQDREQALLAERTSSVNKFAAYTSALLLIAALLSIIVTVASFLRINNDLKRRTALQLKGGSEGG
jgi:CHASE3 domain sensor protein